MTRALSLVALVLLPLGGCFFDDNVGDAIITCEQDDDCSRELVCRPAGAARICQPPLLVDLSAPSLVDVVVDPPIIGLGGAARITLQADEALTSAVVHLDGLGDVDALGIDGAGAVFVVVAASVDDDGEHLARFTLVDEAGNSGDHVGGVVVVDARAPALVTADLPELVDAEAGSTVVVTVDADEPLTDARLTLGALTIVLVIDDLLPARAAGVVDVGALGDGRFTATLALTDLHGNRANVGAGDVVVDRTPPALVDASADPAVAAAGDVVFVTALLNEAIAACPDGALPALRVGQPGVTSEPCTPLQVGGAAALLGCSLDAALLSDGAHAATLVDVCDEAGNRSAELALPAQIVVDATPPSFGAVTTTPRTLSTASLLATVDADLSGATSVTASVDGVALSCALDDDHATCSGPPPALTAGTAAVAFVVTALDDAGNRALHVGAIPVDADSPDVAAGTLVVDVDVPAPHTVFFELLRPNDVVTFVFDSTEPLAAVEARVDGTPLVGTSALLDGTRVKHEVQFTIDRIVAADVEHAFIATLTDDNGNRADVVLASFAFAPFQPAPCDAACGDGDGDGFLGFHETACAAGNDCDDLDATTFPGAPPRPDNGKDDGCSGRGDGAQDESTDANSVFVAGDVGNDANPGTRAAPRRTLNGALAAINASRAQIVATASPVTITDGTLVAAPLFGGYGPGFTPPSPRAERSADTAATGLTALTGPSQLLTTGVLFHVFVTVPVVNNGARDERVLADSVVQVSSSASDLTAVRGLNVMRSTIAATATAANSVSGTNSGRCIGSHITVVGAGAGGPFVSGVSGVARRCAIVARGTGGQILGQTNASANNDFANESAANSIDIAADSGSIRGANARTWATTVRVRDQLGAPAGFAIGAAGTLTAFCVGCILDAGATALSTNDSVVRSIVRSCAGVTNCAGNGNVVDTPSFAEFPALVLALPAITLTASDLVSAPAAIRDQAGRCRVLSSTSPGAAGAP
ncbi:MAG: putative metal-binding motif-containing protein [Deltaproteobacteria bacterium]|nr:putative metal-binding motif-containing protein [Deltaproteobacteria bacterium]